MVLLLKVFSPGLRRFLGLNVKVRGKSSPASQTRRFRQGDGIGLSEGPWQTILTNCAAKFH